MSATKDAADVENVKKWLMAGAPTETERPWAPIETSLPDPDLLADSPPVVSLLPELVAWAAREPFACGVHVVAYGGLCCAAFWAAAPLAYPPNGPAHFRRACWRALAFRAWVAFWSLRLAEVLYRRFLLYKHAMNYRVDRKATLGDVVVARLGLRRMRCPALLFPLAGLVYGAYAVREARGTKRDALCGRSVVGDASAAAGLERALAALALALPCARFILFYYGKDDVEEASLKAKAAKQCSHGHAHGGG